MIFLIFFFFQKKNASLIYLPRDWFDKKANKWGLLLYRSCIIAQIKATSWFLYEWIISLQSKYKTRVCVLRGRIESNTGTVR